MVSRRTGPAVASTLSSTAQGFQDAAPACGEPSRPQATHNRDNVGTLPEIQALLLPCLLLVGTAYLITRFVECQDYPFKKSY